MIDLSRTCIYSSWVSFRLVSLPLWFRNIGSTGGSRSTWTLGPDEGLKCQDNPLCMEFFFFFSLRTKFNLKTVNVVFSWLFIPSLFSHSSFLYSSLLI